MASPTQPFPDTTLATLFVNRLSFPSLHYFLLLSQIANRYPPSLLPRFPDYSALFHVHHKGSFSISANQDRVVGRTPPPESHLEFTTSNFSYITFFRRARRLNSASISLTSPTLLVSSAYLAFPSLSLLKNSFFPPSSSRAQPFSWDAALATSFRVLINSRAAVVERLRSAVMLVGCTRQGGGGRLNWSCACRMIQPVKASNLDQISSDCPCHLSTRGLG